MQLKREFAHVVRAKYPKAVEKLEKDWKALAAYLSQPALHWQCLRMTNVIEPTFVTVRFRTNVTKGAGSLKAAESMAFKLLQDAEKSCQRIRSFAELTNVLNGVAYVDGVMIAEPTTVNRTALRGSGRLSHCQPIPNFPQYLFTRSSYVQRKSTDSGSPA